MKFECESCHAQYMIADEKLGARGVKVKCKRCSHVIIVRPAAASAASGETLVDAAPPLEDPASLGIDDEDLAGAGPGMGLDDDADDADDDPPTGTSSAFDGDTELGASVGHDADTEVAGVTSREAGTGDDEDSGETLVSSSPAGAFADAADGAGEGDDDGLDDAAGLDAAAGFDDEAGLDDGPPDDGPPDDGDHTASAFDSPLHGEDGPFGAVDDDESEDETAVEPPREEAGLRSDSELDADPFFGEGAAGGLGASDDEAPAPPPVEAGPDLEVPEPPPGEGFLDDGDDDQASMPHAGAAADLLDQELSGAFSQMFDAPGDDDGLDRGPTRVLDLGRVDELRAASQRTELGDVDPEVGGGLDEAFGAFGQGAAAAPPGDDADADDDGDWHVAIDDEDVGPLSLRGLGEHIRAGSVDRESLVWRPGMDDWTPAGEIPQVRPLFEQVPMPKIGGDEGRAGAASFDVGQPIDDLKPSPFDDAPVSSGVADPFGALPGFDTDEPDGSWQPHGLTEVYQAANLAEAAGGIGAPAPAPRSRPDDDEGGDDDDGEGWKPGAASALASLVENEIQRIDHGDDDEEQSLPPAADDSLSLNLDEGGLGGFGLPEPETATPPPMQGLASTPPMAAGHPSVPPQASLGGMPMAPYGGGSSALKNPIVLVAGGLGVLLFAVVVLLAIIALRSPQQPTIAQAPTAPPEPAETVASAAVPAPEPEKPAKPAAEEEPAKEPEPAKETAAEEPPKEEAAPAAAAPKPAPKKAAVASKPAAPKPRAQARQQRQQRRQPPKRPQRKGCDPILDLDCDEKPAARAQSSQKATLSPSDVLTVVRKNLGSVNACGSKHGVKATVKMEWRILKSGRTSSVRVLTPQYANTPVGNCMSSAIKRWQFPRFSGSPPPPVKFPFKLKG